MVWIYIAKKWEHRKAHQNPICLPGGPAGPKASATPFLNEICVGGRSRGPLRPLTPGLALQNVLFLGGRPERKDAETHQWIPGRGKLAHQAGRTACLLQNDVYGYLSRVSCDQHRFLSARYGPSYRCKSSPIIVHCRSGEDPERKAQFEGKIEPRFAPGPRFEHVWSGLSTKTWINVQRKMQEINSSHVPHWYKKNQKPFSPGSCQVHLNLFFSISGWDIFPKVLRWQSVIFHFCSKFFKHKTAANTYSATRAIPRYFICHFLWNVQDFTWSDFFTLWKQKKDVGGNGSSCLFPRFFAPIKTKESSEDTSAVLYFVDERRSNLFAFAQNG